MSKDNRLNGKLPYKETQITHDKRSHQLTNINVWTADSQWIAYDVRPSPSSFTGLTIEKIHIERQMPCEIYRANHGAHVGVVTVSAEDPPRYAFIHGPEFPDEQWQYDFHHRRGVYVRDDKLGEAHSIDAMCITPPYLAGALRGGTHVHVFSPDGKWLSFTYNDHVMHERDIRLDQRNVAIAVPIKAVNVEPKGHQREYSGEYFCCVISHTTPEPILGSHQISRAYEEGWIGQKGYLSDNGQWQSRAIAFIGDTHSLDGEIIPEIFIVDLPEDENAFMQQGDFPLQGTDSRLPFPPKNIQQRRLTFTHERQYPGLAKQPRHWLRSSPDGRFIACLMKDDNGVVQLWLASTSTGSLKQITQCSSSIQSAFSWDSQGKHIAFICDNRVMRCNVISGELERLTVRSATAPVADAVVFSPDDRLIAFMRDDTKGYRQIHIVETGLGC
ncbi:MULTISPECIES: DUF3748 domain-containing protein [Providencia]|uniref:DUF3748 domain-containing protein n=1 Tax=Providencia TaxID=586 RepID=UPI0013A77F90|nr:MULTISPECIES: DUF3748 domain-containing protein [Providencia]MBQ0455929.1 DUF3748 domain-containing protein [Providencia stuartii]QIB28510.1 DUF3748 domain-containing protein [Providencia stuartii]QPN40845.1 DUF3748 domain-containing protein [Providencia sp. 2.29]WAZ78511.1 DUF3748 domain-containing protein [Providencia stuartii]WAZ84185.1 DUF3748 domain-containing protein [Providencia stuartii]